MDRRTTAGGARLAATYARAAGRYWLDVYPRVRREARHWRSQANHIPDQGLRALALNAQQAKLSNVEGAAAFAAFAPLRRRRDVVRAQVAFQTMYDYLDTLSEQPSAAPAQNGDALHRALLVALEPGVDHRDYYRYSAFSEDAGYLHALIDGCRTALGHLPSYTAVGPAAREFADSFVRYQSINLASDAGGHALLERWARTETPAGSTLRWWEIAAAAGSSLGTLALITAAAQPSFAAAEANAIRQAYWPWAGALHTMLDHLVDLTEDAAAGRPSLLAYYASPEETAERLAFLAREALRGMSNLPNASEHVSLFSAMVGSYLVPIPPPPNGQLIARAVWSTIGPLAAPTDAVFRAKRALGPLRAPTSRTKGPPERMLSIQELTRATCGPASGGRPDIESPHVPPSAPSVGAGTGH